MHRSIPVAALLALAGCATTPAVSAVRRLDPEAAVECRTHCDTLGMELDAVVVILNSTGCVCAPRDRAASARAGTGAATGGAVITAAMQAAQQQQQQQSHTP